MAYSAPPLTLFKSPHGEKSTLKQGKKGAYFVSIGNFVTFLGKNFYMWIS